jgi:hypothetical protein
MNIHSKQANWQAARSSTDISWAAMYKHCILYVSCSYDTVRSESHCARMKGVGSDVYESVCAGLDRFNFIRKHFLQICVRKVAVHVWMMLKWCPRASLQASTHLILFADTFCRSACEMFLIFAVIAVYEMHCDEVQMFLGIFQQISLALNRRICCLLERRIQQEKHVSQLKEP